jgi:hypothetical protein
MPCARFSASTASRRRCAIFRRSPTTGVELDALAALPAEQQAAAVAAVQNGDAPSVRAAIATSAQPTAHEAANADPLDAILEQIRRLGENEPESLWDALAGQWHEEISRAFAGRLLKTNELRQEALSAGATPSHPNVRGGAVQAINGLFCERVYAIGSLEGAEQQRRPQNGV